MENILREIQVSNFGTFLDMEQETMTKTFFRPVKTSTSYLYEHRVKSELFRIDSDRNNSLTQSISIQEPLRRGLVDNERIKSLVYQNSTPRWSEKSDRLSNRTKNLHKR